MVFKDKHILMFLLNYSNGIGWLKNKLLSFTCLFFLLKIYLWSRNIKNANDLQSANSSKLNNIEILTDLNDVRIQQSDVICTCTASEEALIGLKQVKIGVHINGNFKIIQLSILLFFCSISCWFIS